MDESDQSTRSHRGGRHADPAPAIPREIPGTVDPSLSLTEIQARKLAVLEDILSDSGSFAALPEEHRERLARYAGQYATAGTPYVQCWSLDTPPELVEAYSRVEQRIQGATGLGLKALRGNDRWTRTATNGSGINQQGMPVTVTWSIVPDGTPIASTDSGESTDSSSLRARMAFLYGESTAGDITTKAWFQVYQAVFDNLAAVSGLHFVYEPNDDGVPIDSSSGTSDWGVLGVRGDIRLSGHPIDGNSNVLAYAYYPDNGDVVIDTADSYYTNISNDSIRLRNILEHEMGHALGLGHVCPVDQTKLMEPFINTGFRGSQYDDIYTFQRSYGDPLERHGSSIDNDSVSKATPLTLPTPAPAAGEWLSIDDSSDTDLYSFTAIPNQDVTVRIIPSDPISPGNPDFNTYLEGAQTSGSCSSGVPFDPTNQQNLVLDLIGPDGSTVIASAVPQPAGATEEILDFQLPTGGTHFIRVRGGTADRAQLYQMEAALNNTPFAPQLALGSTRIEAESNSSDNGLAEPDETIRYGITITNVGNLPANNIVATLSGPAGSTIFTGDVSFGTLPPGDSMEQSFTFALSGESGDSLNLQLTLTADDYSEVLPVKIVLGAGSGGRGFNQSFDAALTMPSGWGQLVIGSGSGWAVSNTRSSSPANSIYSPGSGSIGDAILAAPPVTPGPSGGILEFRHRYDLEAKQDGGVLEASRNGGEWFDLMNSAAIVVSGDYNDVIFKNNTSSIKNREAWTGLSGDFVTTRIELPLSWAGETIYFRWLLASDKSTVRTGWNIDDVKFLPEVTPLEPFRPWIGLSASAAGITEQDPASMLTVTVTTPLPLVRDVAVTLEASGTADAGDLDGPLSFILPAGQLEVSREFAASPDGIAEGTETLMLSIPATATAFAAGTPASVSIDIRDPSPFHQWLATFTTPGNPEATASGDLDKDGWDNASEYAFGTLPDDPGSRPELFPELTAGTLRLMIPTPPPGIVVSAETSATLDEWTSEGVMEIEGGFEVARNTAQRFLRVVYEVVE